MGVRTSVASLDPLLPVAVWCKVTFDDSGGGGGEAGQVPHTHQPCASVKSSRVHKWHPQSSKTPVEEIMGYNLDTIRAVVYM